MSKIFLSHTRSDKPFVRKLAADLRRYGHTIWIDEAEINIGDSLIGKIRDGLDSVDFVAVVISEASIQSEWVKKELEIASNREIDEKRVVVLPLILESVELPGFLKGKFYGDFSNNKNYQEQLELLLRSLGDSREIEVAENEELTELKKELKEAKELVKTHKKAVNQITDYNFAIKSEKLRQAITTENKDHPEYAPINNVYAFEVGGSHITLGYLLWIIGKIKRKGAHPLEWALEEEKKWDFAIRMLEAYSEMVESKT